MNLWSILLNPLEYSIEPVSPLPGDIDAYGLPRGLYFNCEYGTILGVPSVVLTPARSYRLTVTDYDGETDHLTTTLRVDPNKKPSFDSRYKGESPKYRFTKSSPISLNLPQALGGNGPLVYELTGVLPPGVHYNHDTVTISGVPTTTFEDTEFILEARDIDGDLDRLVFDLQITLGIFNLDQKHEFKIFTGEAIGHTILTTSEPGLSSTVNPPLPSGLEIRESNTSVDQNTNTLKLQLFGTPQSASPESIHEVRVLNNQGEYDSFILAITIEVDTSPSFENPNYIFHWAQGHDESHRLPIAMNGNHPMVYKITHSMQLPAGLSFHTRSESSEPTLIPYISGLPPYVDGEPMEEIINTSVVLIVTDADGDTARTTIRIRIHFQLKITVEIDGFRLTEGTAIDARIPYIYATGGRGNLSFSLVENENTFTHSNGTVMFNDSLWISSISDQSNRHYAKIVGCAGPMSPTYYIIKVTDQDGRSASSGFNLRVNDRIDEVKDVIC